MVIAPTVSGNAIPPTLLNDAVETLKELIGVLENLHYDEYVETHLILSHGTIGQHTRHIVELFQQLMEGYTEGVIDYDHRKRDLRLSHNIDCAMEALAEIICKLNKSEKMLQLQGAHLENETLTTTYSRELLYNLEHCIHHQAIIKIALISTGRNNLTDSFGVAKSTLLYRK